MCVFALHFKFLLFCTLCVKHSEIVHHIYCHMTDNSGTLDFAGSTYPCIKVDLCMDCTHSDSEVPSPRYGSFRYLPFIKHGFQKGVWLIDIMVFSSPCLWQRVGYSRANGYLVKKSSNPLMADSLPKTISDKRIPIVHFHLKFFYINQNYWGDWIITPRSS